MLKLLIVSMLVFLLVGFAAFPASADGLGGCVFSGTSTATTVDDPELGTYKYCVEMSWDTGYPFALSHADVLLALGICTCACNEFPFGSDEVAGQSLGFNEQTLSFCTVTYLAEYLCEGDPSIPATEGEALVKFEPQESNGHCEPTNEGAGTFCFYSDWEPREVDDNLLVLKAGQTFCFGHLTGDLPECDCTSATLPDSWGTVKALFE